MTVARGASASSLGKWRASILPVLRELSGSAGRDYGDGPSLQHCVQLSTVLHRRTTDQALAQAGFLHCLSRADLAALGGRLPADVLDTLRDWHRVLEFDYRGADASRALVRDLLPTVCNPRSIILSITGLLSHLDPTGELAAWTNSFRIGASPVPGALAMRMPSASFASTAEIALFAMRVLVPMAEYWGFWAERNTADNAVLRHNDPVLFGRLVDFAVECQAAGGLCERQVGVITKALDETDRQIWRLGPLPAPQWEWRHVGSLARTLPAEGSEADWAARIHRCGFVTITCPDAPACYETLGALHAHHRYRLDAVHDYIGTGSRDPKVAQAITEYRAIHTVLLTTNYAVSVRIIPQVAARLRYGQTTPEGFAQFCREMLGPVALAIVVYTPSGRPVALPAGATVLNLAKSIHSDFVALTDHALVNGRQQDLLYHLREGDEVELVHGDTPRPLPEGWEEKVPPETVTGIQHALRNAGVHLGREWFARRGRHWLFEQMERHGFLVSEAEPALDDLLAQTARELPPQGAPAASDPVEWWLRQLGRLDISERGRRRVPGLVVSNELAARFFQLVMRRLTVTIPLSSLELGLDAALREGAESATPCPICNPDDSCPITVTRSERRLILHDASAECGVEGKPVERRRRLFTPRYFVLETTNRAGIAVEVVNTFGRHAVEIVDLFAKRLDVRWGVIRVQTMPLPVATERRLEAELLSLPDVLRVVGPQDQVSLLLEQALPPRDIIRRQMTVAPEPYKAAAMLTDEQHFYGRRAELAALHEICDAAFARNSHCGAAALVTGPLKIGKSSLVYIFTRQVLRTLTRPVLCLYHQAGPGEDWRRYADGLLGRLKAAFAGAPDEHHELTSAEEPREAELEATVKAIRAEPKGPLVVLAMDECMAMLENTQGDDQQVEEFLRFLHTVQQTPGVVVVLCGPKAALRWLDGRLVQALRGLRLIEVSGLLPDEVRDLLCAKNLEATWGHGIGISDLACRQAYDLTRGNPWWLQRLGELMWKQARERGQRRAKYDRGMLTTAVTTLTVLEEYRLADRVRRPGSGADATHWHILCALLEAGGTKCGRVGELKLLDLVAGRSPGLSRDDLVRELGDLQDRGSVRIVDSAPSWAISAPIVAEAIRMEVERTTLDRGVDHA